MWADEPITSSDQDLLNRSTFVDAIRRRIESCESKQSSVVFGIQGPWGSGKTSIINLVLGGLNGWKVVHVLPWATDSAEAVTNELLLALYSTFEDVQKDSKWRGALEKARPATHLLKIVPGVGDAVHSMAVELMENASTKKTWSDVKMDLEEAFSQREQKVLVVVDDIDRMEANELLAFLRAIRLLGNFSNVHYLLAYDREVVEQVLKTSSLGDHGPEFLEKIVQYPIDIHRLTESATRKHSEDLLNQVLDETGSKIRSDDLYRKPELTKLISLCCATPRSRLRLREKALFYFDLLGAAEIDALDLLALALFENFFSGGVRFIGARKEDLLGDSFVSFMLEEKKKFDWPAVVADELKAEDVSLVISFLEFLFPKRVGVSRNSVPSEPGRRICNRSYFQRYMALAIGEDDISDATVNSWLDAVTSGQLQLSVVEEVDQILFGESPDQAQTLVDKISTCLDLRGDDTREVCEYLLGHEVKSMKYSSHGSTRVAFMRRIVYRIFGTYQSGGITSSEILDLLDEDELYFFLRQVVRERDLRQDFAQDLVDACLVHYRKRTLDSLSALTTGPYLRRCHSLQKRISGELDPSTKSQVLEVITDSRNHFENFLLNCSAVSEWVSVSEWVGAQSAHHELNFDREVLEDFVSGLSVEEFAALIPERTLSPVDIEDTSEENLKSFVANQAWDLLDQMKARENPAT